MVRVADAALAKLGERRVIGLDRDAAPLDEKMGANVDEHASVVGRAQVAVPNVRIGTNAMWRQLAALGRIEDELSRESVGEHEEDVG